MPRHETLALAESGVFKVKGGGSPSLERSEAQ